MDLKKYLVLLKVYEFNELSQKLMKIYKKSKLRKEIIYLQVKYPNLQDYL